MNPNSGVFQRTPWTCTSHSGAQIWGLKLRLRMSRVLEICSGAGSPPALLEDGRTCSSSCYSWPVGVTSGGPLYRPEGSGRSSVLSQPPSRQHHHDQGEDTVILAGSPCEAFSIVEVLTVTTFCRDLCPKFRKVITVWRLMRP